MSTTQNPTATTTQIMIGQIGRMNLLAISGGRITYTPDANVIILPVRHGYSVEVEYCPVPDTYKVRRVFTRGFKTWVKGEATNVYADQLGDTCYMASCYLDDFKA